MRKPVKNPDAVPGVVLDTLRHIAAGKTVTAQAHLRELEERGLIATQPATGAKIKPKEITTLGMHILNTTLRKTKG